MDSRLYDEGVSNPYELADTSYLDEACEVVTELKARQREQNVIAREAGIENNNVNPLIAVSYTHLTLPTNREV